tara:strand:- start:1717 stop:2052 length:336 start_codon:yes stop_codon:yes gene_type:complete
MNLSNGDYLKILKYYNLDVKKMNKKETIKELAEDILATKLCRCIKKVNKNDNKPESQAIGICRKSVLKTKQLKNFGFTCKKKAKFVPKKGSRKNLVKYKTMKTRRIRNGKK